MKKLLPLSLLSAIALLLLSTNGQSKPRLVDLPEEALSAHTVAIVHVHAYDDSLLRCTREPDSAHVSFKYPVARENQISLNPIRANLDSLLTTGEHLTASYPPVGAKVVVIADSGGEVSLFAGHAANGWRFWSPWVTFSVAMFRYSPPTKPVGQNAHSDAVSWDGCVVPDSVVRSWLK